MRARSGAMMPEPQPTFYADRPFLFFLRDDRTGLILFAGRVEVGCATEEDVLSLRRCEGTLGPRRRASSIGKPIGLWPVEDGMLHINEVRVMRGVVSACALLVVLGGTALADSTPRTLPYGQTWLDTTEITVNDNWSGVPGWIGYRGDDPAAGTGVDPQTITADTTTTPVNVIANQANPNALGTGGVAEFEIADPVVALQGSGTADAPFVLLNLDLTGRSGVQVLYDLRDIDGSVDNAIQPIALHYRVGASGTWTNVPAAFVADASTGPSLATLVTHVAITLPAAVNGQPLVQLRWMTANAAGNDEWIGIDNLAIGVSTNPSGVGAALPAAVFPTQQSLLTVTVTPGTFPPSTGLTVTVNHQVYDVSIKGRAEKLKEIITEG